MTTTISIKKEIVEILKNHKGDNQLYLIIFNLLTTDNTVKNYTNNSNGIFFNMNNFDDDTIVNLNEKINQYIIQTKELKSLELDRQDLMKKMGETIDNSSYKTELQNLLAENKKSKLKLSTELDIETDTVKTSNTKQEEEMKLQKQLRMKKSILNYKKPVVYSKVQERIKKVMSRSSSGRICKNKSIEEDDRLYDSDLEDLDVEIKPTSKKNKGKKNIEDLEDDFEEDIQDDIQDEGSTSDIDKDPEDEEEEMVEEEPEMEDLFGDSDSEA